MYWSGLRIRATVTQTHKLANMVLLEKLFVSILNILFRGKTKTHMKGAHTPIGTHKEKLKHAIIMREQGKALQLLNCVFKFQPPGGKLSFLFVC